MIPLMPLAPPPPPSNENPGVEVGHTDLSVVIFAVGMIFLMAVILFLK